MTSTLLQSTSEGAGGGGNPAARWRPAPGNITAAAFAAAVARGVTTIDLDDGTYLVDASIDVPSGVRVVGKGSSRTFIQPAASWTPAAGSADDPTNSIFRCIGTINTGVANTSVNAVLAANDVQLTTLAAATLTDGQWLAIEGSNFGLTDEGLSSTGTQVVLRELVRVSGAVAASTTVPLRWPTAQHHAAGAAVTVKGCSPITDVAFEGIGFAIGGRNFACAISCAYAYNVRIRDVSGGEFCHAMIKMQGCQRIDVRDLHDLGGQATVLYLETCQRGKIRGMTSEPAARRYAANGVPWAKLTMTIRPTDIAVSDLQLTHGVHGIICWGAHSCAITHAVVSDMDTFANVATLSGGLGLNSHIGTPFGAGLDTGATNVPQDADFGIGLHVDDLVFEDCIDSTNSVTNNEASRAVYWHDVLLSTIGSITIANLGRNAGGATVPGGAYRNQLGFKCQDSNGRVGAITVKACLLAGDFSGIFADLLIDSLNCDGTAGVGGSTNFVRLDTSLCPRIGRLHTGNGVSLVVTAGFTATPDYSMTVGTWYNGNGGFELYDLILAYAGSAVKDNYATVATDGSCAVLTDTGASANQRRVKVPAALGDSGFAVIVAQAGPFFTSTGPLLVARGGGHAIVDAAVAVGDILKLRTDQRLTVDNAAVWPVAKFRAVSKSTAAARILVAPVGP